MSAANQLGKYQPYPEYKDSGVEWLGEIPPHWKISKLRYMFTFGKGLSITKENLKDDGIPCVNYGEVHSKFGFEVDPRKHTLKCVDNSYLETDPKSLLQNGDFVFADTSEDIDGSGNFTQLTSDVVTFAGYHSIIARPIVRNNARYFAYLFDSKEFRSQIRYTVKGVKVFSITQAILRGANIWLPSHAEQHTIAAFLDYETTRIDKLIAKQQQLIELLKEKRQAVISHAVTKGLNPNALMKDSGVEWLGEVPEHWVVKKLKHVAKIIDCKNRTPEYVDDGDYLVVRTTNVKNQSLVLDGALYTNNQNFKIWTERGVPPIGSILFTREAPTGEVCLVPKNTKLCMGQRMMNFIAFHYEYTSFLFDYLTSDCLGRYISSEASGSTVSHLRVEQVYNIPVVVPPMNEQAEIDILVGNIKKSFSALIDKSLSTILLLQERRTALISAAVTGKIDLRGWKPPQNEVAA